MAKTTSSKIKNGVATIVAIIVAIMAGLFLLGLYAPKVSTGSRLSNADTVPTATWNAVVKGFDAGGMKVAPRNAAFPDHMVAYLPPTATDMTERQAKELAIMARQRLGGNASVRIKTAAGQTIAGN